MTLIEMKYGDETVFVNADHVVSIEPGELTLSGGKTLDLNPGAAVLLVAMLEREGVAGVRKLKKVEAAANR